MRPPSLRLKDPNPEEMADKAFSRLLRLKYPKCQACGRQKSIEVHHFKKRRYHGGRFNVLNCWAVCAECHWYFENDAEWAYQKQRSRFQSDDEYDSFIKEVMAITRMREKDFLDIAFDCNVLADQIEERNKNVQKKDENDHDPSVRRVHRGDPDPDDQVGS